MSTGPASGVFKGAWLTDVDDTLLKSGHRPDDHWIGELAQFVRTLRKHGILWAPVSGVAISKMGPRMLYRLPEELLDNVFYFGGEGSTRSHFHAAGSSWVDDSAFKRHFTDAQALAVIGELELRAWFAHHYHTGDLHDERIERHITDAQAVLEERGFAGMPCLVDQMKAKLDEHGFDSGKSETYFRGGALSWMMFGDISVQHYRGEHETQVRMAISHFIRDRLEELDHLRALGENGIGMPYMHATRGIKLVLMGNDKGRAAEELHHVLGIPADHILFVGNELFDGGNDDTVRRVEDVVLLSVGEKEDPGVINGGVQVDANRHWMEWAVAQLEAGIAWPEILKQLPVEAERKLVTDRVTTQLGYATKTSVWHGRMAEIIPLEILTELILNHRKAYVDNRQVLVAMRRIQYEMVSRLASLERYHYDEAIKMARRLLRSGDRNVDEEKQARSDELVRLLLPELKGMLTTIFIDRHDLGNNTVHKYLDGAHSLDAVREAVATLIRTSADVGDPKPELDRLDETVDNWTMRIHDAFDIYLAHYSKWKQEQQRIAQAIASEPVARKVLEIVSGEDLFRFFRWLLPRVEEVPHLKDLDKPTIVLVSGTSGVGKSTIAKQISRQLGIPTGFSSDIACRAVMREASGFLLGGEKARELFPELHGSSFDVDALDWFYGHALMTMVGVTGSITRLIKENVSAVIDGVALIPGTLPEICFEKANIVWIVACVREETQHFERLGMRDETGVERGGADRYKERFRAIRNNHDRLVQMGERAGVLVVDNSGDLDLALSDVFERVRDPFADRGLPVDDEVRERTWNNLHERTTWEIQNDMH
jgi:2-phosphoglycerate kinase